MLEIDVWLFRSSTVRECETERGFRSSYATLEVPEMHL